MSAQKRISRAGISPPTRPIRWSLLVALTCVLATGTIVLAQSGTTYDLHWNTSSGGGALSSGANYRINYSFGQPSSIDRSTGSNYQVGQGYWQGGASPTAVKLASFLASPSQAAILVTWETLCEIDTLGFNLYRQAGREDPLEQLNQDLIPSRSSGGGTGASYAFLDTTVQVGQTYQYTLEDVDTSGRRTSHGPVEATAPYGNFLPLVIKEP